MPCSIRGWKNMADIAVTAPVASRPLRAFGRRILRDKLALLAAVLLVYKLSLIRRHARCSCCNAKSPRWATVWVKPPVGFTVQA